MQRPAIDLSALRKGLSVLSEALIPWHATLALLAAMEAAQ